MGLVFAAGTMISLTFSGAWLGADEVEITNAMTVFKQANILGLWSVTIPNIDFFLVGFKSLMMMDFAFFTGALSLLQWFMFMTIGLELLFGLFVIVITVIQSLWRR